MADKIQIKDGKLIVPDQPIIPFIEGDGLSLIHISEPTRLV